MAGLIDIGANLVNNQFRGDLDSVLQRARSAGVSGMIVTGTHLDVSRKAQALAAQHEDLYCTAGVHPHHADDLDAGGLIELRELAGQTKVVALGECGLDYVRNYSTPENQRRVFAEHLELAKELDLPLFLHEREAHTDFLELLSEAWPDLPRGAVVHCFTGGPSQAQAYLELGAHLGITGWVCDERRGQDLRDAVPLIPAERLMLETDAPYLLPRNLKPKPASRRCEPMHLLQVARTVADLRSEDLAQLSASCTRTSADFFGLEIADAAEQIEP